VTCEIAAIVFELKIVFDRFLLDVRR